MPQTISLHFASDSACVFERLTQPARFCAPDWERVGCHIRLSEQLPEDADWIGFHGLPNAAGFHAFNVAKKKGAKLLWSLDDDFPAIPDFNPAKRALEEMVYYDLMKDRADLILCSTPALAATFADVADKVVTAPNLTDLSRFPTPPGYTKTPDGRLQQAVQVKLPVRVMWSGSPTHSGDIELLGRVIPRVFEQVSRQEVQFIFVGMVPPGDLIRDYLHKGVLFQKPLPFGDYREAVNAMRPDVWLAPMLDIPFNLSKSGLRVLEGWSLSAAVIASPVGEYGVIRSGIDGRLADTEDAWVSAIVRLVRDHAYRLELACEGRLRAESEYDWNRRSARIAWDQVWSRVFGVPVPE